jgi:SAM-dependent MidA family methyltransferase
VGNEVLDAMPATLLSFDGQQWCERGVAVHNGALVYADRPTALRPPAPPHVDGSWPPGAVTEVQPQAQAFMAGLAQRLTRGMALLIDYGFPQAEFYHPQRSSGTLMCHRAHQSDANPLKEVGLKDITVHVDFTAMALAAQEAGADVLGYTSQANFLFNCGIDRLLETANAIERSRAQVLLSEHEMGELFKVLAIARGLELDPVGFSRGDRMHRL